MRKYSIEISEILSRIVEVEANDEAEACCIVKEQYDKSDIVLSSDDFVDKEIKPYVN